MERLTDEQKNLVIDNMALVPFIIKNKIHLNGDEYEDLFQEGCYYLCLSALDF